MAAARYVHYMPQPKYNIGQIIQHRRSYYRGVIVGRDEEFKLEDRWYRGLTGNPPPRDAPWYHVLVHGSDEQTYVAERNIDLDPTGQPVKHPLLGRHFNAFAGGRYVQLPN